jgi:hypothetical protein
VAQFLVFDPNLLPALHFDLTTTTTLSAPHTTLHLHFKRHARN